MDETTRGDVRKELLSAIAQKQDPTIEWVRYERADLGTDWGFYVDVAQELEKEGRIELRPKFNNFEIRQKNALNQVKER